MLLMLTASCFATDYQVSTQAEFDAVKSMVLQPGDAILFERGQQFTGMLESDSYRMEWPSLEGRNYLLLSSPTLQSNTWSEVYNAAGTGSNIVFIDTMSSNSFYRLQVQ